MNYKDFNIAVEPDMIPVEFNGKTITVRSWLPTAAKIEFIQFVVSHAMNPDHGTFSPAVVECFETIACIKYFTDIEFSDEDLSNPSQLADEITHSGLYFLVQDSLVKQGQREWTNTSVLCEWTNLSLLLHDTISAIERFNSSFAGTMTAMSGNATELGDQLDSIMEKLKNKEGLEEIAAIKEFMDKTE